MVTPPPASSDRASPKSAIFGTPADVSQTFYLAINGGAAIHLQQPIRLTANKTLGFTSATVTTHSIAIHGYIAP
jgi:hypothetical protein